MRWQVVTLIALLGVGPMASPASALTRPEATGSANNDKDGFLVVKPGVEAPGQEGVFSGQKARSGRKRPLPEHVITELNFRTPGEADTNCLETKETRRDTPMTKKEKLDNILDSNFAKNFGIAACTDEPAAAAVPTPAQVAEAFLREIPLPAPEPRIAPNGTAITGLAAYLETNGALTHTVGPDATELGPIVVEATSVYWVDWGDGSPEAGPFAFEGEAYPSGRIWHGYRNRGDYTVTVRQAWTAEWRLGADSGTVSDLQTEASIPLDVDEVQAVIRYP